MPRLPKDPALRQRRNQATTRATLPVMRRRSVPPLPAHHDWDSLTRAWWGDVWRSPMVSEFLRVDLHGLYLLAELIDRFWAAPTTTLASEIRQQRMCYGLTPIDRRRLEWEVERVEAATTTRRPAPPSSLADDPRKLLAIV
jgi:hypothetical protein